MRNPDASDSRSESGMISSIEAYRYLRATMTECSQKAGWRSLLLRAYDDPPV